MWIYINFYEHWNPLILTMYETITKFSSIIICKGKRMHSYTLTMHRRRLWLNIAILKDCRFSQQGYWRIIIIIIIIIILVITLMQGIYNYIPETNRVSRVYSVAAVLYLHYVLHIMSFRPWNMFCTFTLALSIVCVKCPVWLTFVIP